MQGESGDGCEFERLRERDPEAWKSFYELMYPMMLSYSQRRLGYNESARDAVSEALTRTLVTIARGADVGTRQRHGASESSATLLLMRNGASFESVGCTNQPTSRLRILRRRLIPTTNI